MKALIVDKHAKKTLDHLVLRDIPKPQPGRGQVLVRLKAAALNPADLHIAEGETAMLSPRKPPFPLGVDGAGVIEALGEGVTGLALGDAVMFYTGLVWSGTFAEYIALEAEAVAKKPEAWNFRQTAAASLALLVAQKALDRAEVSSGETLLIHGGGGAVGAATTALAVARGAKVHATGSAADRDYVMGLGAEAFHDYRSTEIASLETRFDMVLDGFGGNVFFQSLRVMKTGGRIVSLKVPTGLGDMTAMGMKPNFLVKLLMPLMFGKYTRAAKKTGVTLIGLASFQDGAALAKAAEAACVARYQPRLDQDFPLDRAKDALTHLQQGRPAGKVTLSM